MSDPPSTVHNMVKFDPEGFAAMMARIDEERREEERQASVVRSPYEDLEPDYEYTQPHHGELCP